MQELHMHAAPIVAQDLLHLPEQQPCRYNGIPVASRLQQNGLSRSRIAQHLQSGRECRTMMNQCLQGAVADPHYHHLHAHGLAVQHTARV